MRLPLPTARDTLLTWATRANLQIEKDLEELRNRFGKILKPAIASGVVELDLALADTFWVTLTENVSTVTALLPRATDALRFDVLLAVEQDGMGSRTWAWPGAWLWPGAIIRPIAMSRRRPAREPSLPSVHRPNSSGWPPVAGRGIATWVAMPWSVLGPAAAIRSTTVRCKPKRTATPAW